MSEWFSVKGPRWGYKEGERIKRYLFWINWKGTVFKCRWFDYTVKNE